MAQYTITGFDASAHLAEETTNASRSAPLGVLMSVGASGVVSSLRSGEFDLTSETNLTPLSGSQFGFFYILSLLFSMQSLEGTLDSSIGQPVFQIIIDCFGPSSAKGLISIILICVWFAGLFSLTSNRSALSSVLVRNFPVNQRL